MTLDYARFVRAQDPVWTNVVAELTLGQKQSHWMWFVFPQLRGLGSSEMSTFFGLRSLSEATDYLAHPILAERLQTACRLVLRHKQIPITTILGEPDAFKLKSSMTLFSKTPGLAELAQDVLDQFYKSQPCEQTTMMLRAEPQPLPSLQP